MRLYLPVILSSTDGRLSAIRYISAMLAVYCFIVLNYFIITKKVLSDTLCPMHLPDTFVRCPHTALLLLYMCQRICQ